MFYNFLFATYNLFINMTPYLVLGFLLAGILYVLMPKDKITKYLGRASFSSSLKASMVGVPLPLCSCSVVPTAVSIHKRGASKTSAFSFLISTPQTGADSFFASYYFLGPLFAVFRAIFAFISGALGGFLYSGFDKKTETKIAAAKDFSELSCPVHSKKLSILQKTKSTLHYAFIHLAEDLAFYLIIGFIAAGAISAFIPEDFFKYIGNGIAGKLLILLIATPMYICSTASIPIAVALISKGVSPGTAFIFLMAGPATNATSIALLLKSFGKKFTVLFIGVITAFAIGGGYLLDFTYTFLKLPLKPIIASGIKSGHTRGVLTYIIAALFTGLMAFHIIRNIARKFKSMRIKGASHTCGCSGLCNISNNNKEEDVADKINLKIEGMSCNHCLMAVKKALEALKGVSEVKVDLEAGKATLTADDVDKGAILDAVKDAGYKASVA